MITSNLRFSIAQHPSDTLLLACLNIVHVLRRNALFGQRSRFYPRVPTHPSARALDTFARALRFFVHSLKGVSVIRKYSRVSLFICHLYRESDGHLDSDTLQSAFVKSQTYFANASISGEKNKSCQFDMINSLPSGEGRIGVKILAHDESRGNVEGVEFH